MKESILAFLGLDTKGFDKGIASANKKLNGLSQVMGKIGIAGGLFFVVNAFRNIIKASEDAEYGVNKNIDAVKRLNEEYKSIGKWVADAGNAIVGSLVRIGDWMADFNSKMLFGAAQEDLDAIRASEMKIAAEEKKLEEIRKRNIQLGKDAKKIYEQIESDRKKAAFEALSDEQKLLDLKERIADAAALAAEQRAIAAGGNNESVVGVASNAAANAEKEKLDAERQVAAIQKKADDRRKAAIEEIRKMEADLADSQLSGAEKLENAQSRLLQNDKTIERLAWAGLGQSEKAFELMKENLSLKRTVLAEEKAQAAESKKQQDAIAAAQKAVNEYRSKAALDELEGRERIEEIDRRIIANQKRIADLKTSGSVVEALNLELRGLELVKQKADAEKEINRTIKGRQVDLRKEIKSYQDIQAAIAQQQRDRLGSSLDEVAGGKFGRGAAGKAKRVQGLEDRAQQLFARGRESDATGLMDRAKEMRKSIPGLSDSERDPTAVMKEQLEQQKKQVSEIEKVVNELKSLRTEPVE